MVAARGKVSKDIFTVRDVQVGNSQQRESRRLPLKLTSQHGRTATGRLCPP